jgi:hypothetical protein
MRDTFTYRKSKLDYQVRWLRVSTDHFQGLVCWKFRPDPGIQLEWEKKSLGRKRSERNQISLQVSHESGRFFSKLLTMILILRQGVPSLKKARHKNGTCPHDKVPIITNREHLRGSIIVLLTSCLAGLDSAVWHLTIFVFIWKTD